MCTCTHATPADGPTLPLTPSTDPLQLESTSFAQPLRVVTTRVWHCHQCVVVQSLRCLRSVTLTPPLPRSSVLLSCTGAQSPGVSPLSYGVHRVGSCVLSRFMSSVFFCLAQPPDRGRSGSDPTPDGGCPRGLCDFSCSQTRSSNGRHATMVYKVSRGPLLPPLLNVDRRVHMTPGNSFSGTGAWPASFNIEEGV